MGETLAREAIQKRLGEMTGWTQVGDTIQKQFAFESFMQAIRFVNRVAERAEEDDHHPDITINYRKVLLSLSTHSEGGLTRKDFILAKKIEGALHE